MTLRLTDEQNRTLTQLAESQGVSKQEAVIRAIDSAASRHAENRAKILARIVEEDSALLDLLAK